MASSLTFCASSIFSHNNKTLNLTLIKPKTSTFSPSSSFKSKLQPQSLTITSQLTTLPILSFTGEQIGETYLDLKSAPPDTARAVVHRALITDLRNKRRGTASTLTRGEVRGGGRKPYPQKKTGRARRGSQRTPLRPGGGVVFGPKPRDWSIKINRKEKRLAMSTALCSALGSMSVVEDFSDRFEKPRTRDFVEAMKRWGIDPKEKSMFFMTDVGENVELSSRNIGTLRMLTPRTLNLFDILNADKLVLTPAAVDFLNSRYGVEDFDDDDSEENEDADGDVAANDNVDEQPQEGTAADES